MFGSGIIGWFVAGPAWVAWSYLVAVVLHHAISYDRLAWLFRVDAMGAPPFED